MRSERGRKPPHGAALRTLALLIAAGLAGRSAALGPQPDQNAASEYEVKAVFIHHLTRYLQWPRAEASGSFVIAVLGESAIVAPLQAIAAKGTIHERRIAIRPIADLEALGQPQVLFVAKPAGSRLAQVLRKTRGRPILTIAEEEGFAARGMAVNFILRGESVKFEINEGVLRGSGIEPGSQLLRLAILVKGQG